MGTLKGTLPSHELHRSVTHISRKGQRQGHPQGCSCQPLPSNPTVPSNTGKAVPQTGDDNFIFLYGGLLALAVIGGGVFMVCRYRKGKSRKISPKTKAANIAVISLCAVLALGSGFLIVRDLSQYAESAGTYDGLAEHVEIPEQAGEPASCLHLIPLHSAFSKK